MHLVHVIGARPNFMKAAPVIRAFDASPDARQTLIHTGQHYDVNMSDVFFQQLGIPEPNDNLQVGSGSHAQQTADVMVRLESKLVEYRPDWVIVYGDVNSTVAAALVCAKLRIKVAHVEAGLRSFDRSMPEEINRIVTDRLADLLFTPSQDGNDNLLREGVPSTNIRLVGNVMIDTLIRLLPQALARVPNNLPPQYALVTIHRPANVDDEVFLQHLLDTLYDIGQQVPVMFPVHPRTRQRIQNLSSRFRNSDSVRLMPPLSYLDFLALQTKAMVVITDSGGIQEETTFLSIPCLTVRENTERPITTIIGSNVLVGRNMARLRQELQRIIDGNFSPASIPPLWDGHAAERIAQNLLGVN